MNRYQTLDLVYSLLGFGVTTMAFYFSVISAYLVVAYLAGKELEKIQVVIINILFLAFSLSLVYGTYNFFLEAYLLIPDSGPIPSWLPLSVGITEIFGIVAALFFMKNNRKDINK